jgi:hypothetical protein
MFIEVLEYGNADYDTQDGWIFSPYCESNTYGQNVADFKIRICRYPPTGCEEGVMLWFNGDFAHPVTFTNQPDSCKVINCINAWNPQDGSEVEICIGKWNWNAYQPINDEDATNNCVTVDIPVSYCEDGCVGDSCSQDLPVFDNTWGSYMWFDNSECIDEFGNEAINEGDCAMSVENNNWFIYETVGTENFCMEVSSLNLDPNDEIQYVVWDLSVWPWDGDCSVVDNEPLLTTCDFTNYTANDFQSLSVDTAFWGPGTPMYNQYLIMIDGSGGDHVEYEIDFCGQPILLSILNFAITLHSGVPVFTVDCNDPYWWVYRSSNLENWQIVSDSQTQLPDYGITPGLWYYEVRSGAQPDPESWHTKTDVIPFEFTGSEPILVVWRNNQLIFHGHDTLGRRVNDGRD